MNMSVVEYFADNDASRCGYCRGRNTSYSNGMWSHVLTCSDYQDLIDRGWRRSGRYCYKPTMDKTCCPQYTIKCDVTAFTVTKSQKKVLKKFRNYILKGPEPPTTSFSEVNRPYLDSSDDEDEIDEASSNNTTMDVDLAAQEEGQKMESKLLLSSDGLAASQKVDKLMDTSGTSLAGSPIESSNSSTQVKTEVKTNAKPSSIGPDPDKPKARKKKELRREKAMAKKQTAGISGAMPHKKKNEPKGLEELTSTTFPANARHKFEIRLVNAQTSDENFMKTFDESFRVYKKYQVVIHRDAPTKCDIGQFKRFLCNASLLQDDEDKQPGYRQGAFHQQYVIDGKIMAVGVIDILPHCISSVYLYYDPDYAFLSPGTLTSLFEIAFVRNLQREKLPSLKFYYMGYYIHSCPKMRYKAKYHPSWLVCPVTYEWIPVNQAMPLLDKSKFAMLNQEAGATESNKVVLGEVLVLYQNKAMPYKLYTTKSYMRDSDLDELEEYAGLIGGELTKKILLFRSC
jgi:arginine-tRNA-protein transferase